MFRIAPYSVNTNVTKDVFDLFDDFFKPSYERKYSFRVDVKDTGETYIVDASLPGILKKDVSLKYENELLTISVNKEEKTEEKDDNDKYLHREIRTFSSSRKIHLKDVDPKQLKATMENGILTVTLPKLKEKLNSYMIDID